MYFILYKDVSGQWRWNINAANHKIIAASSESYINKQDAIHSINLVKTGSATDLLGFFEPVIPVERLGWGERDCAA